MQDILQGFISRARLTYPDLQTFSVLSQHPTRIYHVLNPRKCVLLLVSHNCEWGLAEGKKITVQRFSQVYMSPILRNPAKEREKPIKKFERNWTTGAKNKVKVSCSELLLEVWLLLTYYSVTHGKSSYMLASQSPIQQFHPAWQIMTVYRFHGFRVKLNWRLINGYFMLQCLTTIIL